ncbi:MAG: EVE domain-containing protein [Proteobacteria bacterium]|nr:EVE domain-containing protein [Pseudomonadota bacterium]
MIQQFWIGVVSKEHVLRGKTQGFAQVCHGKEAPLKRMRANDFLVYYSPHESSEKKHLKGFTAIGIIQPRDTYQVTMSQDFKPFRRDVKYLATGDAPIRPLIPQLSFIHDKTRWGSVFRFGILKIPKQDFIIIATAMGLTYEKIHELLV